MQSDCNKMPKVKSKKSSIFNKNVNKTNSKNKFNISNRDNNTNENWVKTRSTTQKINKEDEHKIKQNSLVKEHDVDSKNENINLRTNDISILKSSSENIDIVNKDVKDHKFNPRIEESKSDSEEEYIPANNNKTKLKNFNVLINQSNPLDVCKSISGKIDKNNTDKSDEFVYNKSKTQSQCTSNSNDKNIDYLINNFSDDLNKNNIDNEMNPDSFKMQNKNNENKNLLTEPKVYTMIELAMNEKSIGPFKTLVMQLINESTNSKSRLFTINNHFNKVMYGKNVNNRESINKLAEAINKGINYSKKSD